MDESKLFGMPEEELDEILSKSSLPTDGSKEDKAARLLANPRALLQENTESTTNAGKDPNQPMPDAPVTGHPSAESNYDGQYMLNAGLTEKITNEAARTQNSAARKENIVQ